MHPESSPNHSTNLEELHVPVSDPRELLRVLLLDCRFDSVDLWPLFGKEPHPSFGEIANSLRSLLFADGIARTRPLQRVSLDFITLHAEECAINAERWGNAWGQWMNEFGDRSLQLWNARIQEILHHLSEDAIKSHPEVVFIYPAWLNEYKSELCSVQENFLHSARAIFLKMQEQQLSPASPHLRTVVNTWGSVAYGLINTSLASLTTGFSPEEFASIKRIANLLDTYDQNHLLADVFFRISPTHYRDQADIFYEAIAIDPSKIIPTLELFPRSPRRDVQELALNALRYGGPTSKETLSRLGEPREEFIPDLNHLVFHSGVFGYQSLRYRLPNVLSQSQDDWLPELHRYGHGFWALMAKFKTELLEGISQNRLFIDEVFPLCTSGAGRFLYTLPLSLWNEDGLLLADLFRESAGEVWNELKDDALSYATDPKYTSLRTILLEKGRIRGIHRYIPSGAPHSSRFNSLSRIADRLEDTRKNGTGKKTALFLLAGTDPLNSFGGASNRRIIHHLLENFDLTIHEARSQIEVADSLNQIHIREEGAPLPLSIIAAHGDSYGMQLGGLRHMLPCIADRTTLSFKNYLSIRDRELVTSWKEFFSQESDLVILSCSNFLQGPSSGGFGRMIQEVLSPATVHGMRWNMVPLHIEFDGDSRVKRIVAR
jgi:hypothetical protein